ncbi:MAG: UvrABC system protein A [Candidatus Magasanikbacteria bacterium GW2011_GWA2_56_11]|uniref:UvrABC system protein A n=1 Tax=Candidatus Magasanikbacteria bacterium GW2011_GWA2_56_11 TaxID=1619044 RepID=A0A0G1YHD3_9BACT|nr:MAG: UvrABC system protein A [Candidatus Magasanikbacteria bacterium GW2011_GWA2_56_11]
MPDTIKISGARVHNLKNVSLSLPKNKLVVITGLSGSGKSSLAFDTIYAEGQRRYAESLNAYARQFMDMQDKPDVDEIQGLSPTIAIQQRNFTGNPRSTVGTATEIYDYLRLLYARLGTQYCPTCKEPVKPHTKGEIAELIRGALRKDAELTLLAPLIRAGSASHKQLKSQLEKSGIDRLRVNGVPITLKNLGKFHFNPELAYDIDLTVATADVKLKPKIVSLVEKTLDLGNGFIRVSAADGAETLYSLLPVCGGCGREFAPIEPRSFSFNSPYGACSRCTGLGRTLEVDPELVIPNPRLTLAEGAIQPWTRLVGNQNVYQELLEQVAERYGFSIDTPADDLPKAAMDVIFYGTDGEEYLVDGVKMIFEGVIPNLTKRYLETKSDYVKKEIEQYMREKICSVCQGKRLKEENLFIKIHGLSIAEMVEMSIEDCHAFFEELHRPKTKLRSEWSETELAVAVPVTKEILRRLGYLMQVGLPYLNLDRSLNTVSGGESQRIRLSTQLSAGLSGLIYILDEPSIGLHPKDNDKLITTLKTLRDAGNTVVVVEHDKAIMEAADYIVDVGPGAGEYGGEIIAEGTPNAIRKNKNSLTGRYLGGTDEIRPPSKPRQGSGKSIVIEGAKANNLKNIDVSIPLGTLVCFTGVSGSGKSTLVIDILSKALDAYFYRAHAVPGEHASIKGLDYIDKVITIDQAPIGRTPRSNPATYTGLFTLIRDLFAELPEAKMRGMNAGMFSFNVKDGGRCEACGGEGYITIPMHFLNDVFIECTECRGTRYTKEVLEIHYQGRHIADVLDMTVEEAYKFFQHSPNIREKLQILRNVGLGYVHLRQPATTLSGGEAQRIKLATELARRSTGKTLYILDEPSTGLHFEDIKKLLHVLNQLVDKGNTVLIIEHNLDIIKACDWIIDLGPGGGKKGGEVVAIGSPKDVTKNSHSWTGKYLRGTR